MNSAREAARTGGVAEFLRGVHIMCLECRLFQNVIKACWLERNTTAESEVSAMRQILARVPSCNSKFVLETLAP